MESGITKYVGELYARVFGRVAMAVFASAFFSAADLISRPRSVAPKRAAMPGRLRPRRFRGVKSVTLCGHKNYDTRSGTRASCRWESWAARGIESVR